MATTFQVTFDAKNPQRLAEFWAIALGYVLQPPPSGFETWTDFAIANEIPEEQWDALAAVVDPDGTAPRLLFQKVPEDKTAKNRIHLDVNAGASAGQDLAERKRLVDTHVERLAASGATVVQTFDPGHEYWVVMQDPEGNEFCVQ